MASNRRLPALFRALTTAALTAVVAGGLTATTLPSAAAPRPTAPMTAGGGPVVRSLAVPRAAAAARTGTSDLVAELPATATPTYGLVAVTWEHQSASQEVGVRVRARVSDSWTPWQVLEVAPSEGPSESEESDVRDGTAPIWAGDADGVAVRVTSPDGIAPRGLQVVTVAPGTPPAAAPVRQTSSAAGAGDPITAPPKFPAMPPVVTRKQWGADRSLGDPCWSPIYGSTAKMVFIHHTVNTNDYTRAEAPGIVRSIQAYHTQGRGWCDIAYNFLVDRFGTIYEGRRGGMRLPVRGAHSGDYNVNSVGISLIGNFDEAKVPAATKNAVVRLVGWRLGTSYVPAIGKVRLNRVRFDRISGHRDAMSTTCPGRYAYAWLPTLRRRVADYLSAYRSPIPRKRDRLGRDVTGPVFEGEIRLKGGRRTRFGNGEMFAKSGLGGPHWLTGRALTGYHTMHGTFGRLGFPTGDEEATAARGVTSVGFEHGRIFLVPRRAPRTLWGRVLLRYHKLGSVTGSLGLPTSSEARTATGALATFQGGTVIWDRATGKVSVVRS